MSAPAARTMGLVANTQSTRVVSPWQPQRATMDETGRQPSPSCGVGYLRVNGCPDMNSRAVAMSLREGVPPSSLWLLRLKSETDRIWSEVCVFGSRRQTQNKQHLSYRQIYIICCETCARCISDNLIAMKEAENCLLPANASAPFLCPCSSGTVHPSARTYANDVSSRHAYILG